MEFTFQVDFQHRRRFGFFVDQGLSPFRRFGEADFLQHFEKNG
jgi:hypothetical protein